MQILIYSFWCILHVHEYTDIQYMYIYTYVYAYTDTDIGIDTDKGADTCAGFRVEVFINVCVCVY